MDKVPLTPTDEGQEEKCSSCRYWDEWQEVDEEEGVEDAMGTCRRHAPQPRPFSRTSGGNSFDGFTLLTEWPRTCDRDWCGDWKAKAVEKVVRTEPLGKVWVRPENLPPVVMPEGETRADGWAREKRFKNGLTLPAEVRREMKTDGAEAWPLAAAVTDCKRLLDDLLFDFQIDIDDEEWQRRRDAILSLTPTNDSLRARTKFFPSALQILRHLLATSKTPTSKKHLALTKTVTRLLNQ